MLRHLHMSLLNNFYATTLSVGHQKYTALQRFPYRPNHQLAPTVYSPRNVHYHYSIGVTSYFHDLRFNGIWNRCRVTSRYNQQNRNPQEKNSRRRRTSRYIHGADFATRLVKNLAVKAFVTWMWWAAKKVEYQFTRRLAETATVRQKSEMVLECSLSDEKPGVVWRINGDVIEVRQLYHCSLLCTGANSTLSTLHVVEFPRSLEMTQPLYFLGSSYLEFCASN